MFVSRKRSPFALDEVGKLTGKESTAHSSHARKVRGCKMVDSPISVCSYTNHI